MVSRTVRDLVAGLEVTFEVHGTHELKGVGNGTVPGCPVVRPDRWALHQYQHLSTCLPPEITQDPGSGSGGRVGVSP